MRDGFDDTMSTLCDALHIWRHDGRVWKWLLGLHVVLTIFFSTVTIIIAMYYTSLQKTAMGDIVGIAVGFFLASLLLASILVVIVYACMTKCTCRPIITAQQLYVSSAYIYNSGPVVDAGLTVKVQVQN